MFSVLVASFVIACCLITSVLVTLVLRSESRKRRMADEVLLAAEPVRPAWIYARRMDVPRKRPMLPTRNSKVW